MAAIRDVLRRRVFAAVAVAGCCHTVADAYGTAAATGVANASASPTTAPAVVVQQPRPFGYVLGDTLTQRILLRSASGNFDPAALPPAERAGLWFARRSSKIAPADNGNRWLIIDYQIVNSPQTLMTANLPAVNLKAKAGNDVLATPEWPVSIAPLTPRAVFAKGGLQELRTDHPAPLLPASNLRRQLEIWSSAAALTVVLWLGWWLMRTFRAAANQPFARALREIRRTDANSPAAWLSLHRAFDRTAGRALQLSTLPALFKRAPHFEPERGAIEQFYGQSNLRFFGAVTAGTARSSATGDYDATANPRAGIAPVSLRALVASLRRIEKRQER
jgi:mxaA protein